MQKNGLHRLIGLESEKQRAHIDIVACQRLGETYPHTILYGVGGTGKTAVGRAIAYELGYFFYEKEAAALRSRADIVELLCDTTKKARRAGKILCLFVDEVHRLTELQQEVFYFPMVEWRVDAGDDDWIQLYPFTLVAATTKLDRLDPDSFVKRFRNIWHIRPYSESNMIQIIGQMFRDHGMSFEYHHLQAISRVCNGIPRTADRLVVKVRNHAVFAGRRRIEDVDIANAFTLEGIVH